MKSSDFINARIRITGLSRDAELLRLAGLTEGFAIQKIMEEIMHAHPGKESELEQEVERGKRWAVQIYRDAWVAGLVRMPDSAREILDNLQYE
jgi:hypothetical protein